MKKYIYQKFLLNCNYDDINLEKYNCTKRNLDFIPEYGQDYCLFDIGSEVIRKIKLTHLDDIIDTEEDWNNFIDSLRDVDVLILVDANKHYNNEIIQSYRIATLKAYLKRLQNINTKIELA